MSLTKSQRSLDTVFCSVLAKGLLFEWKSMDKKVQKKSTVLREVVDWLASLRVTVYTMIVLGGATLVGTVFPQLDVTLTREVLAQKMDEPLWRALHLLGFTDVFRSVWFLFLVALLMANLIACTVRYLQRLSRTLATTSRTLDDPTRAQAQVVTELPAVDETELALRLTKIGRVYKTERDGRRYYFAQNSPLNRYGIVFVHLSILLILAGAVVRLTSAVEGQMNIPEGGSLNFFTSPDGDLLRLPFDVDCNAFAVEFYPDGRRPKEFTSDLTVHHDGSQVAAKTIQVNDPLKVDGFRFFQASYGRDHFVVLQVAGPGVERELPVIYRQVHSVPGTRDGLIVDGERRSENGSEVHVALRSGGEEHEAWLAQGGQAQTVGAYTVSYLGAREGYYTGLLVAADPGQTLLWTGFALFFVGLFWSMFSSHRRVWACVTSDGATLAGTATRRREQLAAWIDATAAAVKKD